MSVQVYRGTNPLSPDASADGVSALIIQGVPIANGGGVSGIGLNESKMVRSVAEAELIGITQSYDETEGVMCYYHIKEFFRLNPKGELWIMIVAQSLAWSAVLSGSTAAKRLLSDAAGKVRILGVAFNPLSAYTPVIDNAIDSQLPDAISAAQLLSDYMYEENKPLPVIVIEGRGLTGNVSDLIDLRTLSAPNVSVVIGADHSYEFRDALANDYANASFVQRHAAVGTLIGAISRAQVNHSVAWVEKNDVQDVNRKVFLAAAMSNSNLPSAYTNANLSDLKSKGWIHFYKDVDAPGTYISDSPTCVAINTPYAFIELNRTMAKASKGIRAALLPSVAMPVVFNPDGKLRRTTIEELSAKAKKPLEAMVKAEEVSAYSLIIDPAQDVLGTQTLVVRYEIVPTGTARTIEAYINFINPFNT
ncbi:MAG: DUF2586 family protein [Bacteroidia bacterium]|nr:DUF2586 family protein [Bacteroidia bacterium]